MGYINATSLKSHLAALLRWHNGALLMKISIRLGIAGISVCFIGIATARSGIFDKTEVFLLTWVQFSLIVNVLLPARFILSLPNLKEYVTKFIEQNLLIGFRNCFSSSRVDVSE